VDAFCERRLREELARADVHAATDAQIAGSLETLGIEDLGIDKDARIAARDVRREERRYICRNIDIAIGEILRDDGVGVRGAGVAHLLLRHLAAGGRCPSPS
jgi:hypothetical protein